MADFVAVLKKTIDGLGEATPEMRERVYDKARATISAKLAAISPPPPQAVADRQRQALEDAIRQVEADFWQEEEVGEPSDPLEQLENVFAALKPKPVAAPKAPPVEPLVYAEPKPMPANAPRPLVAPPAPQVAPEPVAAVDDGFEADGRDGPEMDQDNEFEDAPAPRRRFGGLIAAAIGLVVFAGGGYAVWLNKDDFAGLLGLGGQEVAATDPAVTDPAASAAPTPPATETAAADPAAPAEGEAPKFTQRLNADGTEVDSGPAGGESSIGEGTTVAAATQPPAVAGTAPPSDATAPAEGTAPAAGQPTSATAPAALPVGQKAIFYEERTNLAQGSAETGSIVWSLVQESPGGDLPPEAAIRAEATIPGKDLQLRMTIRRNGDRTLPASHIVELIFLTPEGFEGGGIENILRFALKESEEAAGNQLLGIPARIAPGFFLVALNDTPAEIEANMTLLRREKWIDVPIVYKSGRRALITMEKGIPGDKVFDEALKTWQANSNAG